MLISPPFLPTRQDNETESAWLDRAMREAADGMYPVGQNLCWHGGVHLEAPTVDRQPLPVRAIADGVVRCVRAAAPNQSSNPDHAQSYAGWTDNGVVVIEHNTEIGAAADNTPVAVRFYSIYQHLIDIPATVRPGQPIYRKAELGHAGYIDGQPGRIHFEIACDGENLQHLIGRNQGQVATDRDGRSDVVFGEIYARLPSGTPVYTLPEGHRLLDNSAAAQSQGPAPRAGAQRPPAQALAAATATTIDCYIGLRYAMGDGPAANRGDLTLTTYREDGSACGQRREANGEYNLYNRAKAISEAYPATGRPAPSAVYELLRFGRVINTANETLTPADVPHWREIIIPTADGTGTQSGWVNLNNRAEGQQVRLFSDADFPHWRGWQLFDDDLSAGDSRCDSDALKTLLDVDGDHHVTPDERRTRMQDVNVRSKLRHAICAMPSEWNAADLQARWSWLQQATEENPTPLVGENYDDFIAHAQALSFEAPQAFAATWRFHPRGFIEAFKKCGWLSREELVRIYPNSKYPIAALRTEGLGRTPETIRDTHRLHINRTTRKYSINTPVRLTHFLGQGAVESQFLSLMIEGSAAFSRNPAHASFRPETNGFYVPTNPNDYLYYLENVLGNVEAGDGPKFRGRGMKQLTGRENYAKYWVYRGWLAYDSYTTPWYNPTRLNRAPQIPNPQQLSISPFNAIDAGGWYWEAGAASNAYNSMNSVIVSMTINRASVREVARAINGVNRRTGDPNQLAERLNETLAVAVITMDAA